MQKYRLPRLALVLAQLLSAATAAGQQDYAVAAGCPPRESFDKKLRERLSSEQTRAYGAEVSVRQVEAEYRGTVRVTAKDTVRVRTLSAASCAELIDALALSAALSMEELEREARAPAPAAVPPLSPAPERAAQPSTVSPGPRLGAGASVLYRSTLGPDGALGVGALVAFEARGEGLAPAALLRLFYHSATARGSTGSAELRTLGAALDACPARFGTRWSLAPCVSLEVASLRADARGVTLPKNPSRLYLAAGAGGRGRFFATPALALGAELFVLAPLKRHRFVFDSGESVFQVPSAGARVGVAATWFFL